MYKKNEELDFFQLVKQSFGNMGYGLNQWFSKFEKNGNANEPVEIKLQRSGFNFAAGRIERNQRKYG